MDRKINNESVELGNEGIQQNTEFCKKMFSCSATNEVFQFNITKAKDCLKKFNFSNPETFADAEILEG